MIIYKSTNIERWNKVMLSDIAGHKFYCANPVTKVKDLGFELERKVPDMLIDINKSESDMFEEVWQLQEQATKMEDVYELLISKYDFGRQEVKNLLRYLCLCLPCNDKGNPVRLETWKKSRNKITIKSNFMRQSNGDYDSSVHNFDYIIKQSFTDGGFNFQRMLHLFDSREIKCNILSAVSVPVK